MMYFLSISRLYDITTVDIVVYMEDVRITVE